MKNSPLILTSLKVYKKLKLFFVTSIYITITILLIELIELFLPTIALQINTYTSFVYGIAIINLIALTIFLIMWFYQFHRDMKTIDDTYPITKGGALARFFIPIYNIWGIWNIFDTYASYLEAQSKKQKSKGMALRSMLPIFYILLLTSRITGRVLFQDKLQPDDALTLSLMVSFVDIFLFVFWIKMTTLMQKTLTEMNIST